jgi:hypothetical protein
MLIHHLLDNRFTYHDIFIRNAFGNYRDILHEVSRSPIMSDFLTLAGSNSYAYDGTYPDENFAREIMQLFTIGLWELEVDGTRKLDSVTGEPIPTYSNDDVATFAKVWTGFDYQVFRGNVEKPLFGARPNYIDPTVLKSDWRDRSPKTKLGAGYIGDKNYPLCAELPVGHFLRKGATYRYLGANSLEGAAWDASSWVNGLASVPEYVYAKARFAPSPLESTLYDKLCAAGSSGRCTFPLQVVVQEGLPCHGMECRVEKVDSVMMVDGNRTVWYEYLPPPCVRLAFFHEGKYVNSEKFNSEWGDESHCTDPTTTAAAVICCDASTTHTTGAREQDIFDRFAAAGSVFLGVHAVHATEQVSYPTAVQRCASTRHIVCPAIMKWHNGAVNTAYTWGGSSCTIQVQVVSNGWVSLVSPPRGGGTPSWDGFTTTQFPANSADNFRIRWQGGAYPTHATGCATGSGESACVPAHGNTCLCNITVDTVPVYVSPDQVPSAAELEQTLFIGAASPDTFDTGEQYAKCTSTICRANADVSVHLRLPPPAPTSFPTRLPTFNPTYVGYELPCSDGWQTDPPGNGYGQTCPENTTLKSMWQISLTVSGACGESPGHSAAHGKFVLRCPLQVTGLIRNGDPGPLLFSNDAGGSIVINSVMHWSWNTNLIFCFPECANSTDCAALANSVFSGAGRLTISHYYPPGPTPPPSVAPTLNPSAYPSAADGALLMDTHTIFELPPQIAGGPTVFRLNRRSVVRVGDFSFRNPPLFMPTLADVTRFTPQTFPSTSQSGRQPAENENSALIDHLFEHENTPPFVAFRLIQRFVSSNPSPRYIKAVATAFKTGTYAGAGHTTTFGAGKYGDLAATIAAVLLVSGLQV